MIELTSPLTDSELRKIDTFIIENESLLLSLKDENLKTLQNFITKINYFKIYCKNLSTDEELKAWNYLYSQTITLRKNGFFYDKYSKVKRSNDNKNTTFWGVLIVIAILVLISLIVAMCSFSEKSNNDKQKEAFTILNSQEAVKTKLKDAQSAEFKNMKGMCGEVNAKNGFGAYTGFKRYVASGEIVVIEGQIDQSEFNKVWHEICN